jgi:hypothetical protein
MQQKTLSVEEICRKLKPLFGNKIDQIYLQYSTSDSFEEKNEIFQALSLLYQKNLNKLLDNSILLEPPKEAEISGEYPLGEVVYSGKKLYAFGLNEKDWPRHVCITGMSGSGKTNFAFNILENFIGKDKPFLVFDWKKSFRPLIHIDSSLMIFTIGNDSVSNLFKTNINVPPKGVSPKEWITVLADLLAESFSASFGVHKILLQTLDEVFEGWGVYNLPEGKRHYPNWMHIKKMLEIKSKEAKGRESQWYESALRIASVLTFGSFGKVINYEGKKNLSIEEIFDKRVIFELNSLSNIEKKFFCEFILTYIYKYKKARQNRVNEDFNYAILVDEAHNVFLKDKTNFVSESVTDMAYREMREYGISLICLDQHISKLSDTVKGNSACHISFQQQLPQDVYDLSLISQLNQNRDYFSKIPVGSAIVKLSERYTSPFLIETPLIELRTESVSDEKINSRMSAIISGIEIEKDDKEFKDSITYERELDSDKWILGVKETSKTLKKHEISSEKPSYEITEIPSENEISEISEQEYEDSQEYNLDYVQKVLYNFIKQELEKGHELKNIEKVLEKGLSQNQYTSQDILIAVNKVLDNKLKDSLDEDNLVHVNVSIDEAYLTGFDEEERAFLEFLIAYPEHDYSTVELYKNMGFSARKGNLIKNQLLKKGIIEIQEKKNKNGWKKYIRLSTQNPNPKKTKIQIHIQQTN